MGWQGQGPLYRCAFFITEDDQMFRHGPLEYRSGKCNAANVLASDVDGAHCGCVICHRRRQPVRSGEKRGGVHIGPHAQNQHGNRQMPGDGFGQLLGRFGGCQTVKVKRREPRRGRHAWR